MGNVGRLGAVGGLLGVAGLAGCGFFPATTTTGGGGTTTTTADYAYVVNQTTDSLTGFVVGTGTLTGIASYALVAGLAPVSVVVTRPNSFVYVGGNGAISCYSIGTGGALTAVSGGGGAATANFISMDTSPDGQWLLGLDSLTLSVYVYKINTSTGALTLNSTTQYAAPGSGTASPRMIRISPSAGFVAVSLGAGGDVLFTFNTTTGAIAAQTASISLASGYSDNAVLFSKDSGYAIFARGGPTSGTSTLAAYSVSSTGVLTTVQGSIASGNAPFSLALDSTGGYVYAANRGDSTISGYSLASGTLTALGSSPYGSGSAVTALALDNTGKYLVAASSGGSSDVTLYGFDAVTSGKLDALATAASGTDPAGSVAVAMTH